MTNLATRLAEIRARAQAATPGPWRVHLPPDAGYVYVAADKDGAIYEIAEVGPPVEDQNANGNFIAHARQDVEALCDALEKQEKDKQALLDALLAYAPPERHNDIEHDFLVMGDETLAILSGDGREEE